MCRHRLQSRHRRVPVVVLAAVLAALAMPAQANRDAPADELEQPQDSALVYFIRERHWEGSAYRLHVFGDRQHLGVLRNNSCFAARLAPGPHLLWTGRYGGRSVHLVAGRTYYFVAWFGTGLTLLDDAEARALVAETGRTLAPTPSDRAAAEHIMRLRYREAKPRE